MELAPTPEQGEVAMVRANESETQVPSTEELETEHRAGELGDDDSESYNLPFTD